MQAHILLVESDSTLQERTGLNLRRAGHRVEQVRDGESAWRRLADQVPDLVMTGWVLPGMSGLDLARRLREHARTSRVALIVTSTHAQERERVIALDNGADDFVASPFSYRELLARVAAVLRRRAPHLDAPALLVGPLELDRASRCVLARGQRIALGQKDLPLLMFLMASPERVHTRERLIQELASVDESGSERTIDARIARIRAALKPHGLDGMLQTVRGCGYCLARIDN